MSENKRAVPWWLSYLDLACATAAGGLWYASSGWWPLLIALFPWGLRFALTRRLSRRTPFDLPLALFLLTAVMGIWVAFDREAAWARFWLILGGVFIFYALANAEPAGGVRVWFLALLGAAVSVVFVLTNDWQASAIKIGFITRLGEALQAPLPRLPGPEVNANIAGAILAMLLPFAGLAAVQAWYSPVRGLRPSGANGIPRGGQDQTAARGARPVGSWLAFGVGAASLLLVAFGWVMTTSRGAWVAVLGALFLAGLWLMSGWLSRGSARGRGWILGGCLGLGLVVVAVVVVVSPATIVGLLDALPGPSVVGSRLELWRNSLLLVRDYPFTGLGLDGFMMAYSTYVMLLHVGFAPHTHNLYLDVAIEQGLPALLLLLVMAALFFRAFWQRQARAASAGGRGQMAAAALSLLVILLHGLVDDPLYKSRAVLFLFIPLAFASSPTRPALANSPPSRRHAVAISVALVLTLAAALLWRAPLLSQVESNRAAVLQSRAELSDYTWPEWPIQDEVRRQVDLGPAIGLYERALALDPGNASANRRLGQIELSLGQYELALGHLELAYAADPSSNTAQELLGEAYLANGREEEGLVLWSGVSNAQGQLEARIWWYEHIGEKERAQWMRWAAGQR